MSLPPQPLSLGVARLSLIEAPEPPDYLLKHINGLDRMGHMSASKRTTTDLAAEIGKRSPFTSLRQEAYLNLVRTHERLSSQFDRVFKQHGLSAAQYNALRILRGEGTPMQIYQIAERMVSPQPDISRLIDRLAAAGLVERERCREDRRVVWVTLSAEGRSKLKRLDRPLEDLHKAQFPGFTEGELRALNRALVRARCIQD